MNRSELEHLIREAGKVVHDSEVLVFGSQAGREKDLDYLSALMRHKLINLKVLHTRLDRAPVTASQKQFLRERILRLTRENPI